MFGGEDFENIEVFIEENPYDQSFIPAWLLPGLTASLLLLAVSYLLI